MKRLHRAVLWAAIGAVVGGASTAFAAILVYSSDPRFFAEGVGVSAIAGVIGGMVCGLLFGALARSAIVAAIAGLGGGMSCCVAMVFGAFIYDRIRWPSPRPYPGCESTVESGGGAGYAGRIEQYTVALSLEEVEQYYESQMARYCVGEWHFAPSAWGETEGSIEATCAIRRPWREQSFRVVLFPISDQRTRVKHIDSWEW